MTVTDKRGAGGARRRSTRRAAAIAIAAAATGLAWLIGRLAHVDYVVDTPFGARQITLVLTVVATSASGLVGWSGYALLERYTASARRVWIPVTLVVVGLSIIPVFMTPGGLDTQFTLSALHCVAAAILIPGLPQIASVSGESGRS